MIGYADLGGDEGSRQSFKMPQKLSDLRIRISNNSSSGSIQFALFYSLYTYTTVNPTDNLDMFIKKKYRLGKTLKSLYMYAK